MPESEYKSDMNVDERVMMAVVRVAELFKKESSAIFKNYGLTFAQYNVLRVLDASKNGQNTVRDVNRILLVSGSNMTGITKRMEKTGFIIRKSDPNDDRLKWLEITPKGRQVLNSISDEKERNVRKYLNGHSAEKKVEILSILQEILNGKQGKNFG
jgi:MarR family 2-MHQ and catechol resistance regulon transcriptional repressor